MKFPITLAFGGALLASACTALGGNARPVSEARRSPSTTTPVAGPLYARDGSIVAGALAQSSTAAQAPSVAPRELGPSETGRTYILELYQKAIDERDLLRREVDVLNAQASANAAQLAQSQAELQTLQARVATLQAESQQRLDENITLASRLVTAQIRRLQAEKVLLESRLTDAPAVAAKERE